MVAASAEVVMRVNVNMAHQLLGHRKENRRTAQELGWVLTQGTMQMCEHCAKSKAKLKKC